MVSVSKYIIDTSAMLSQKSDEQYRRTVYRSLWNKIDEMVQGHEIVTCSETASEVQDDDIKKWMAVQGMQVLPIDDEVQDNVREIVTTVNNAFLIATAKKYGLTVITEESVNSPRKIPMTCQKMDIKCMNLLGFMEENGMAL